MTTTVEQNQQQRLHRGTYDLLFDMQCFHVLRENSSQDEEQAVHIITDLLKPGDAMLNSKHILIIHVTHFVLLGACLLKPGGVAVVVAGALTKENENLTIPGPPKLTKEELLKPFLATGDLCLESCTIQRFCATPYYTATFPDSKPPEAWVSVFRKK